MFIVMPQLLLNATSARRLSRSRPTVAMASFCRHARSSPRSRARPDRPQFRADPTARRGRHRRWSCRSAGSRRTAPRRSVVAPEHVALRRPGPGAPRQPSARRGYAVRSVCRASARCRRRHKCLPRSSEKFVYHYASINAEARLRRQVRRRPHADADDDQIGGEPLAGRKRHGVSVLSRRDVSHRDGSAPRAIHGSRAPCRRLPRP